MTKRAPFIIVALALFLAAVVGCVPRQPFVLTQAQAVALAKREVLPNGTRLVLVPQPGLDLVTVRVMVGVGSRQDPTNGTAHLLEHLMLARPTPGQPDLRTQLNALGAFYHANTHKDYTTYYAKAEGSKLESLLVALRNVMAPPLLDEAVVSLERSIVTQEALIAQEDRATLCLANLLSVMFPGDALGNDRLGSSAELRRISAKDLLDFHAAHYVPHNVAVVVAGNFSPVVARRLVMRTFGAESPSSLGGTLQFVPTAAPGGQVSYIVQPGAAKATVIVGFPALAYGEDLRRAQALSLAATILGGSSSSRLYRSLRLEQGLSYDISAGVTALRNVGYVTVQADLNPMRLRKGLALIIRELKRMKDEPVTAAETGLIRQRSGTRGLVSFEETETVSLNYGASEMYIDLLYNPDGRTGPVTPGEVQAVAREFLRSSRMFVSVITPVRQEIPFSELISQLGE
jgi:predicted Zn-dependent peptidase